MPSSRTLVLAGAALAVAVGVAALLLRPTPTPPLVVDATMPAPVPTPAAVPLETQWGATEVGGTYAGTVVDTDGKPVAQADVLLVGVDTDAKVSVGAVDSDGSAVVTEIPAFGVYKTVARTRTDAAGRFSLAAGGARVVALVGWQSSYSPGLLAHTPKEPLRPGPDHVVRLALAGWLKGQVVDAVTKEPVPRCDVSIAFQTRTNQDRAGPEPINARNAFPVLSDYVAKELGPLVWGAVPPPGDIAFHVATNAEGRFTFGPVMNEVQVEVVISHPEYMWTDQDAEVFLEQDANRGPGGKAVSRIRRPVIAPGETLEKTYYLEKGREVRGTVLDQDGKPIANVLIALDHVAQYAQHWWYRRESRIAWTDAAGHFRVAGLSYGPYVLRMTHPTFDVEYFHGVKEGSDDVYKIATGGGWIELDVDGGPSDAPQWSARATIEGGAGAAHDRRDEPVVVKGGKAVVERVKPGRYDVFLVAGTTISNVAQIEVLPGQAGRGSVRMTPAGSLRLSVRDHQGRVIDPVVAELMRVGEGEGAAAVRLATLVSREGSIRSDGVLPGRYVAELRSPGHVPARTEPFDVAAGSTTTLPTVVLRKQAYLQVKGLSDEHGRALVVDATLWLAEGGNEYVRKKTLDAGLLPVTPGPVMLKVETVDGRRFEQTFEVADGATVPVEIRVTR